ncbi:MAG: AAA family ATPase [Deltaproteobacteria bacterium]|nr:AAA family ATPase [Deltaproteobacteria bacterium]
MKDKHGDLARVGLPGLLNLIYIRKDPSAVLDIIKEPIKKRFFFRNGMPVAASSNILNEVLGRLLMQEGVISQQQYQTSLETVLKEKKRHGEVLISMGLLTPEALDEFLALQLKRRLFRLFDWGEGSYRYIKTDLPAGVPSRHFHPASLILEGISLGFYPVAKIRSGLSGWLDKKALLSLEGSDYRLDDFRLNLQEQRFAESVDGLKTLSEALDNSDLLRHRAESIALSLAMTGLIKDEHGAAASHEVVLEEAKETHAPEVPVDSKLNAELLFMRAKSAIAKKEFSSAIATLKEITNMNPAEGEYWAWLGWAVYNEDPSKIKEAESIIKDSIDLNNDLDSAWHFLGIISLAQGNTQWAKKALETALAKNPWNTEALSELKRLELSLIYRHAPEEVFSFFGYAQDPFSPVPNQVALTGVQTAALESLTRAIRKKSGPVFLEGGSGTGKTTVILELLKKLSTDKMLSALVLKPPGRELDLLKEINRSLGCTGEASTVKEQLLSLGMRVSQNRIQGGSTLIIIDEAHRLSPGCLKLIQYLSRLKAVQLLLSGESSLSERLATQEFSELGEKISSKVALGDLTKEETVSALDSMLLNAAVDKKPGQAAFSISLEEAEEIFEATSGNPGAIRKEAASLLQKAFDDLNKPREETPEKTEIQETQIINEEAVETPPLADSFVFLDEQQALENNQKAAPEEQGSAGWPEDQPETSAASVWPEATETQDALQQESHVNAEPEVASASAHSGGAQSSAHAAPVNTGASNTAGGSAPDMTGHPQEPKRSLGRLVLWFIIMIAAGIIVGSFIGTYLFRQDPVTEEPPATSIMGEPVKKEPVPVDAATPADSSLDIAAPEGSVE